jgi:hypothetical protein
MLERNNAFDEENKITIEPKADPRPEDHEKIKSLDDEERTRTIFESSTTAPEKTADAKAKTNPCVQQHGLEQPPI